MKKLSCMLALALVLAACKKEKNITPSHWKIDGVEYSSDNVTKAIGKAIAAIDGKGANRFDITFYYPYLPQNGYFDIVAENLEQNPEKVVFFVYRGDEIYNIAPGELKQMEASEVDGKAKYSVPLSWFVSYYDPTDSVQIEGVFFEP